MEITRENPNANVAIFCPYIFFAEAFKGILEQYPDAEIVPDFTSPPAGRQYPEEEKNRFRAWLTESSLPWRDIETSGLSPKEFFAKYGTVVAPYYGGWVAHPALKKHKKVRVFYGAAKDVWGFSLWNAYFNTICTPGPYFSKILSELYGGYGVRAVSTGEPKLDRLTTISSQIAKESLSLSPDKPVVLVASTWGKLSSLAKIAGPLISMSSAYQVVVKIHHMTSVYEPDGLNVFAGTSVRIIDQTTPIADALHAADVVVSDGSGAIFDTLVADKPIVLIDTIGTSDESFYLETAFYGIKESKLAGVSTRAASLEQIIKKPDLAPGPVVEIFNPLFKPKDIEISIEKALANSARYQEARQAFLKKHFAHLDGMASVRVAEEIRRLAHSTADEESSEKRSLLITLVDDFQKRISEGIRSTYEAKENGAFEYLKRMQHIQRLPYFQRLQAIIHEFFN